MFLVYQKYIFHHNQILYCVCYRLYFPSHFFLIDTIRFILCIKFLVDTEKINNNSDDRVINLPTYCQRILSLKKGLI